MNGNQHQRFALSDASFSNGVKRDIARLATKIGFSETETGKINIVVSEMASNLVRHVPQGGELLVRLLSETGQAGIEIISLDKGPGMAEPQRMQQDGVSTYGSAGEGLGAIKRQSDFFDLYSQPASGSIILSRIFKTEGATSEESTKTNPETGSILVAKRLDDLCGDGWSLKQEPDATLLLALDGLGHGKPASVASEAAIRQFQKSSQDSLPDLLKELHAAIIHTRGAVGAVARICSKTRELRFCGIGNISAKVMGFGDGGGLQVMRNLMSYNGTIGHIIPANFQEQKADWLPGNILVMHSDGLKTPVDLNQYPKLHLHDPTLIAAALFRDFNRGTDDALVLIAKAKN